MQDLHDLWKAKKELAEKLYKLGMKKRHEKMKQELKDDAEELKIKILTHQNRSAQGLQQLGINVPKKGVDKEGNDIPGDGDEYVEMAKKRFKERTVQLAAQMKTEEKFPVAFEDGLGKYLDKVMSYFKKGGDGKDRDETTIKACHIIERYRKAIAEGKKKLELGDDQITHVLNEALDQIEKIVISIKSSSMDNVNDRIWSDVKVHINEWNEAKKSSEKAHKAMLKNKEATAYLKSEKYDSFPFKLNRGIGTALEGFKNAASGKVALSEVAAKVKIIVQAYTSDIQIARKKYEKLIPMHRDLSRDVLEPLEKALERIQSSMEQQVKSK